MQMVGVAQLVRVPDCGSEGRGFESHLPPKAERGSKMSLFFVVFSPYILKCVRLRQNRTEMRYYDPRYDTTFKKLFHHPDLLISFLNASKAYVNQLAKSEGLFEDVCFFDGFSAFGYRFFVFSSDAMPKNAYFCASI